MGGFVSNLYHNADLGYCARENCAMGLSYSQ